MPCDFLEGVAHCTLLISEQQASSDGMVEVSSSLIKLATNKGIFVIEQICMQSP